MNVDVEDMQAAAGEACALLKALANQDRLLILCNLATGEKNVSELQELLLDEATDVIAATRAPPARSARRTEARGKEVYYRIASEAAARVLELLYEMYCPKKTAQQYREEVNHRKKAA